MPVNISIVRKKGFILNPDDLIVNAVFRALERTDGHCPTPVTNRFGHDQCPCSEYLQKGNCYCKLYIKENEKDS